MGLNRRLRLLVFTDAVGISDGYKKLWDNLLSQTGLDDRFVHVQTRSAYSAFRKQDLLEWSKQRKQPGFNTDATKQAKLVDWILAALKQHEPDMVMCMDPAMLFLLNPIWSQATIDKLRGGLYLYRGVPWIVSLPITAFHNKMKQADIAKLNEGYTDKVDFEEYRSSEDGEEPDDESDEETMEWHEPIIVPMGRIILRFDLEKTARILRKLKDGLEE